MNLIETSRTGNIFILMSLVSRTNPYQFLFDCPSLSLFLHHLGFSQVYFLFSCFPQSLYSDLQTHDSLVLSENTKLSQLFLFLCQLFFVMLKPHLFRYWTMHKALHAAVPFEMGLCVKPTRSCQDPFICLRFLMWSELKRVTNGL